MRVEPKYKRVQLRHGFFVEDGTVVGALSRKKLPAQDFELTEPLGSIEKLSILPMDLAFALEVHQTVLKKYTYNSPGYFDKTVEIYMRERVTPFISEDDIEEMSKFDYETLRRVLLDGTMPGKSNSIYPNLPEEEGLVQEAYVRLLRRKDDALVENSANTRREADPFTYGIHEVYVATTLGEAKSIGGEFKPNMFQQFLSLSWQDYASLAIGMAENDGYKILTDILEFKENQPGEDGKPVTFQEDAQEPFGQPLESVS